MVKGNVNMIIRVFNTKSRNNVGNEARVEIVGNRGKRGKEAPEATFNGFKLDKRKVTF